MLNKSQNGTKENLTQRAYLNTLTGGIDFGAKQVVGFILNPIVISVLGLKFYGVWKILSQLNNYMMSADINVAQPLKLFIARHRTTTSEINLQNFFSASFFTTLLFLPLYLIVGLFLVWVSPYIAGIENEFFLIVRTTMAFLVFAFIAKQLFSLFEAVLRGMNIAYKRMGVRALITIMGGLSTAKILYEGYGLPGMAVIQLVIVIFTGITMWMIVYKNVDWFKFSRIELQDIKKTINLSGKFMLERLVRVLNKSSDLVLLGILAGPTYVGIYSISRFLMNAAIGSINKIIPAVTPGFGRLIGEKKYEKLLIARSKVISLVWFSGSILGSLICLWNESFIITWIGSKYFAGYFETFLIVILGIQVTLQEIDGSLINISLDVREKIKIGIICLLLTIALSLILIPLFDILGLLVGLIVSKIIIGIKYSQILGKIINNDTLVKNTYFSRNSILSVVLIICFGFISSFLYVNEWFHLIICLITSLVFLFYLFWKITLTLEDHIWMKTLLNRINFMNK